MALGVRNEELLFTLKMRDDASKTVRGFGTSLKTVGTDATLATRGMTIFGASLGRVAGLLASLGVALTAAGAIRFFVTNTIEAEAALAQLGAVLKSTGNASGKTAPELIALSKVLQTTTAYSDDAVVSLENVLLTFKEVKGDTFDQAVVSILDMSTALKLDLQGAAIQVGKALQDPIQGLTALRRVGVQFTDSEEALIKSLVETGRIAEAQQIILRELQKEFGGSAAAARNTLGGALKTLSNIWGDLFELNTQSSGKLRSAINELIRTIQDPSFKNFIQAIGVGMFSALTAVVKAVGFVATAFGYLGDTTQRVVALLITLAPVALTAAVAMKTLGLAMAFVGLKGIGVISILKKVGAGALGLVGLSTATTGASGAMGALGKAAAGAGAALGRFGKGGPLVIGIAAVAGAMLAFRDSIVLVNQTGATLGDLFRGIGIELKEDLIQLRTDFNTAMENLKTASGDAVTFLSEKFSFIPVFFEAALRTLGSITDTAMDYVVSVFDGSALKIVSAFGGVPKALAALMVAGAQGVIDAIEFMINSATGLLNQFIDFSNNVIGSIPLFSGDLIPKIPPLDFGSLHNQAVEDAGAAGDAAIAEFNAGLEDNFDASGLLASVRAMMGSVGSIVASAGAAIGANLSSTLAGAISSVRGAITTLANSGQNSRIASGKGPIGDSLVERAAPQIGAITAEARAAALEATHLQITLDNLLSGTGEGGGVVDTGGGGGGGGGGGSNAAVDSIDKIRESIAAVGQETAKINSATQAYLEYGASREIAANVGPIIERVKALGLEKDAADALVQAYIAAEEQRLSAQETLDFMTQEGSSLRDVGNDIATSFGAAVEGVLTGSMTMQEAFAQLAGQVAATIVQFVLLKAAQSALGAGAGSVATGGGILSSILGGLLHEGGVVGEGSNSRRVPAGAFAGAPRFHSGLNNREFATILEKGERVLTADQSQQNDRVMFGLINKVNALESGRQGGNVTMNINTPDANSFRKSRGQVAGELAFHLRRQGVRYS